MDLGLRDKVALVGGSSRGLGRACALALAEDGARVVMCARGRETLEVAAGEIRERTGGEVLAVAADLSSAQGVEEVLARTVERFGGPDVLVANSGGPAPGLFDDLDDDAWRQGFEVVTLSFVRFVRASLPYMRERKWGRIVAIQSSSVKEAVPFLDLSNGIRPGIAGLVKALVPDLAKDGITINLVLPGMFLTSRINPALKDEPEELDPALEAELAPLAQMVPMGRLGHPRELASLVAFLASERASYITGVAYQVDGGRIRSNV
ncbi:MAG TPA: SDR family oxidoreductase [Solirubrobacteraceae bacterium]|nr:SDR family oxidoreductase [Solirubrobacteraceae bacterium]